MKQTNLLKRFRVFASEFCILKLLLRHCSFINAVSNVASLCHGHLGQREWLVTNVPVQLCNIDLSWMGSFTRQDSLGFISNFYNMTLSFGKDTYVNNLMSFDHYECGPRGHVVRIHWSPIVIWVMDLEGNSCRHFVRRHCTAMNRGVVLAFSYNSTIMLQ